MARKFLSLLFALTLALASLAGCTSAPQVRSISPEDNPEHHYLVGMGDLENGKIAEAQAKFERALYLDKKFSRGYAGLAIACAEKAKLQNDDGLKQVEIQRSFESLKKAGELAEQPEERFDCAAASIRLHTLLGDRGWLAACEEAYRAGSGLKVDERRLSYYQGSEALAYFMGEAYLAGLEFQKARDRFSDVLGSKAEGKWHERADLGWQKTDRIVRAMAGITVGDVGKRIAVKDAVTRADLAALMIDELKLEKLLAGRIPVASQVAKLKAEFTPADVTSHPFKEEVLTVMKWKVRGMEPKFDEETRAYLFKPAESVSRSELAFILEDLLIKLTGDDKLATAFFGQEKSPFPDVRPTAPYYNAVLNVTTRGIIEGELSGEFRPNDPVTGAEAILAIRVLNQKKNIY